MVTLCARVGSPTSAALDHSPGSLNSSVIKEPLSAQQWLIGERWEALLTSLISRVEPTRRRRSFLAISQSTRKFIETNPEALAGVLNPLERRKERAQKMGARILSDQPKKIMCLCMPPVVTRPIRCRLPKDAGGNKLCRTETGLSRNSSELQS